MLTAKSYEKGYERYILCHHDLPIDVVGCRLLLTERLLKFIKAKDEDDNEVEAHAYERDIFDESSLKLVIFTNVDCDQNRTY